MVNLDDLLKERIF